jgi:hypothetical protein
MNDKILKLLYRSFDEKLTPAEQQQLKDALHHSKELQEEQKQIAEMRLKIKGCTTQKFKPFFVERVIQKLSQSHEKENRKEVFFYSLISVFRPVAIVATILLLAIMSFNVIKTDRLSFAGAFATTEVSLEEAVDPMVSLVLELEK